MTNEKLKSIYDLAFVHCMILLYFLFLWIFNIILKVDKLISQIGNLLIYLEVKLIGCEYIKVFLFSFIQRYDQTSITIDANSLLFEIILFLFILIPNYLSFLNYIAQLKRFSFIKDYIMNVSFGSIVGCFMST